MSAKLKLYDHGIKTYKQSLDETVFDELDNANSCQGLEVLFSQYSIIHTFEAHVARSPHARWLQAFETVMPSISCYNVTVFSTCQETDQNK